MVDLTFSRFRYENTMRNMTAEAYAGNRLADWSESDIACALAGEVGEACNLIKKRRRGDAIPVADVAKELADVFTYLDMLASKLDIDLAVAVADKFNEVSKRIGYIVYLSLGRGI